MNCSVLITAIGHIDDKYVTEYALNGLNNHSPKKESMKTSKSKPVWIKWVAVVACLCAVVMAAVYFVPDNTQHEEIPTITYNGQKYAVVGAEGEASILKKCGLPEELTADLAGDLLGHLIDGESGYVITDVAAANKLFVYAPQPNENVYILLIDGKYFAAIKWENGEFIGLVEQEK